MYAINAFRLYLDFKEFTVRADCEAICKYHNQINRKKSSTHRWVLFEDIIIGNGYKVIFEHIKGNDNKLSDLFSHNKLRIFPPSAFKFKPTNHIPSPTPQESSEQKPLYIIYKGPQPELYISFEEVIMQKAQAQPASISFMKHLDITAALGKTRKYLGADFYIEPRAKAYIQNYKGKNVQNLIYPKQYTDMLGGYTLLFAMP
ncbi:hypothetical protein U9M48_003558 [Paspalum notatum var. saurae]|uniref:Reverse transcriptase RNase H-like domain-containing protein n=1 Tax=Paspalum notatum var. saurae TaxID=547442 RepID=A0AAQ3PL78_PASNO